MQESLQIIIRELSDYQYMQMIQFLSLAKTGENVRMWGCYFGMPNFANLFYSLVESTTFMSIIISLCTCIQFTWCQNLEHLYYYYVL